MDVQLPDGTVVQGVPDGTTKAQLAEKLKANGKTVPKEWLEGPKRRTPNEMTPILNPGGEAVANIASGMVAGPVSGLAGLAGAALPGPQGQGAEWQRKTQEALTYEPRSEMGKTVAGAITAPFTALSELAGKAGGAVTDIAKNTDISMASPLLTAAARHYPELFGMAADVTLQSLPMLASKGARGPVKGALEKSAATIEEAKVRNFVEDKTWNDARAAGFKVPPAVINPTFTGRQLERWGGPPELRQQTINENQVIGDRIAKEEAGILDKEPLDQSGFEAARQRIAAPYEEVAQLSPVARTLWKNVREKRREANLQYEHYFRNKDPKSLEKAETLTSTAERMEGKIEDIAVQAGNPDLVTRLKAARVQFAKNYQVEKATNVGNGHVDLGMIGRDVQKKPLANTGGLAVIGKFARGFSDYVGKVKEVKESPPHLGIGLSTHGIHGYLFEKGIPMVGGTLRSAALSDMMQKPRSYQPGLGVRLSDLATKNPAAFSLVPSVGLRRPEE